MSRVPWWHYHSIKHHVFGPLWLRVSERLRWRIVHVLNRSDRYCWSDLVGAALTTGGPEFDACDVALPLAGSERCRTVCDWSHPSHTGEHECNCYCGKFRFTAPDGAIDRREGWRLP